MSKDDTTITIEGAGGKGVTMTGEQFDKVADRLTGGPEIPVDLETAVLREEPRTLNEWLTAVLQRIERIGEYHDKALKAIDSYLEKHMEAKRDARMFADISEQLDEQRLVIEKELDKRPFELEG